MRLTIAVLTAAALAVSAAAPAQEKIALVGGRLVDGLSPEPIADSVILVEGERITKVGRQGALKVPEDFEVVSTEGMTVLPGLWEAHAHLMIVGHADYEHWNDAYADRLGEEIMPAAAYQLLMAGITSAREVGGPLEESVAVRKAIAEGETPGPRLFITGPFLQNAPYPGTAHFRWGVESAADGREKVRRLAEAGVDMIKLIDQDRMPFEAAEAIVEAAHKRDLPVLAHAHRPAEIRRGLKIGVDDFQHTGLATAPEFPEDIMTALTERTAKGRVFGGPLYWTPTVAPLWDYGAITRDGERLDDPCWKAGLTEETIADIEASIAHPERLGYHQLTPQRKPTLKRKFAQLDKSGVVMLAGTDSGVPMTFHCDSLWRELDLWVREMGVDPMAAIRAATYWPAKLMEAETEMGSVTPGNYADIIAVEGDVLAYPNLLQDVDFVMKGGEVVKRGGEPLIDPPEAETPSE